MMKFLDKSTCDILPPLFRSLPHLKDDTIVVKITVNTNVLHYDYTFFMIIHPFRAQNQYLDIC